MWWSECTTRFRASQQIAGNRGILVVEFYNMESRLKPSVLTLLLLGLAGCSASHAALRTPWFVEVNTSGGFAGRGIGTYAIASDGTATARLMNDKQCSWRVPDDQLSRVTALLTAARPEDWESSYSPENTCCDRIAYTLTFDEAGTKTTTHWIDDPRPMPPDLTALANAIVGGEDSIRVEATVRCK